MSQNHAADVQVAEHNKSLIENKIAQKVAENKDFEKTSQKWGPLISESINRSLPLSVSTSTSTPAAQNPNVSQMNDSSVINQDSFLDVLNESVSPNYLAKAIRFYMLLKEIPGIDIDEKRIKVGDDRLWGLPVTNISQLIKPTKYLSFNLTPLLKVIQNKPEIVELISNDQAKKQLKALEQALLFPPKSVSFKTSTPRQKSAKNSDSTLRGETAFFSDANDSTINDGQRGSGKGKKNKKKKNLLENAVLRMDEGEKKIASSIYHDVKSPALFASKELLKRELEHKLGKKVRADDVLQFLLSERAFTQYRNRNKRFPRRRIRRGRPFETMSCDLG